MRIKPAIRIKWSERDSFMREEREGQINTAVTVNGSLHCGGLRTHFLDFDLHHISLTLHISYRFSVAHIKGDAQFIVFITNHLEGSTLMTNLYYFDFIFIFLCGIKHQRQNQYCVFNPTTLNFLRNLREHQIYNLLVFPACLVKLSLLLAFCAICIISVPCQLPNALLSSCL